MAKNFRDVKVWEKAHQLTLRIYEVTRNFPKEELVGLTGQMRRTSAAIPIALVEGLAGGGDVDFPHLLDTAQANTSTLDYYLLLAKDLNYFDQKVYDELAANVAELKKMLAAFRTGLRAYRQ